MKKTTFTSVPLALFMCCGTAFAAHNQQSPTKEERGKQMMPAGEALQSKLHDELGDRWTVERKGTSIMARRNVTQPPSENLKQRVDDQIRSLQKEQKNVTATFTRDEVHLRGSLKSCDDLVKSASDFAKIDGVNQIRIDASCSEK